MSEKADPVKDAAGPPSRLAGLGKLYRLLAYTTFNALLLFLFLNTGLWVAIELRRANLEFETPLVGTYGIEKLLKAYPDKNEAELRELLEQCWSRSAIYHPYTQFKEGPFESRYVNVSEHGYRHNAEDPGWPLSDQHYNIFILGGSTTFGYGIADDETIPAYLAAHCSKTAPAVRVYNFGCGWYYSTQEIHQLVQLLGAGARPDLVVFIDGLNDFIYPEDVPLYTPSLSSFVAGEIEAPNPLLDLPIMKALAFIGLGPSKSKSQSAATPQTIRPEDIPTMVKRFRSNLALAQELCTSQGIDSLFVLQPVPMIDYDLSHHLFMNQPKDQELQGQAYQQLRAEAPALPPKHYLDLSRLQEGLQENLYVDRVHYTAAFSQRIAEAIAERVLASESLANWQPPTH